MRTASCLQCINPLLNPGPTWAFAGGGPQGSGHCDLEKVVVHAVLDKTQSFLQTKQCSTRPLRDPALLGLARNSLDSDFPPIGSWNPDSLMASILQPRFRILMQLKYHLQELHGLCKNTLLPLILPQALRVGWNLCLGALSPGIQDAYTWIPFGMCAASQYSSKLDT